ncbi:MAG: hypothetical protein OJK14_00365 [Achromobacter sp.]|uniref:hypothetical protein n=1 Tax=Achromobacter sp. TaxID=134375 RepID=UPI00258E84EC|nr:hypothetical protein [Achromobacter sp.]MCW0205515.1 hypothetical protein [Achromobacter sp.]
MIPVSLPGGNFYVLMAASLACLATLLTWLAVLATTRSARHWLGGHRRTGTALMAFLAVVGAIFPYQQLSLWFSAQRDAEADAGRKTVLAQPTRLAGVEMPAGTELRLAAPGDLASFDRAVFPAAHPAPILGIAASRLFRYAAHDKQAETLSVEIERDQALDGWLCAHGHRIEFVLRDGHPRFASCHLAVGNTLDQQPVPAGAWLKVIAAAPAPGAAGDAPRWLLRTEGSDALDVDRLPLLKVDMQLDGQRRMLGFEGLLARETVLGDMTYPPGTRVLAANPALPGAQAGDLLFSPSRGRSARRAGGDDVPAGKSVLQAPDGAVRGVFGNRVAGVLDVAAMRIGP